jgi:hypothetical protein
MIEVFSFNFGAGRKKPNEELGLNIKDQNSQQNN